MASPISMAEAKRIVQELAENWGYLDTDMMDAIEQFNEEYRRKIDRTFLSLETAAAHSVKTLAKELYGSDARFIFELLQNADDNKFSKLYNTGDVPRITFQVYESHLVVECNEDGFTKGDLTAICHVGQSTKANDYGYIGAKGIGFKSVFIAATEVYIQSGNFSFKFKHKKDDPGLGMVRPIWVNPSETLPVPCTRMTLRLRTDESGSEDLRRNVVDQLDTLQESCLLFLKHLQCVRIEHYEDGKLLRSTEFKKAVVDEYRTRLIRSSIEVSDVQETTKFQLYHVTKLKAHDLPWSQGRGSPTSENGRAKASSAEVIVAFPLTEYFLPGYTFRQHLFAFLPLCPHDYKFIIHSDFDTKGDREGIIITSKRNLALRKWIAAAIVAAVLEFLEHPTLRYHWPMFLPALEEAKWDSFWVGLNYELQQQLGEAEVLESRTTCQLRRIRDLRVVTSDAMLDGEPLFNDDEKVVYISPRYHPRALIVLQDYGLNYLTANEIFHLVEKDLNYPNPRLHGPSTEAWHSAVAKLFCAWFDQCFVFASRLRSLPLIPLAPGTWTRADTSTVYFPTTNGYTIPSGLDLDILDPTAAVNPHRHVLFAHLGVSYPRLGDVQSSIVRSCFLNDRKHVDIRRGCHFLYYSHMHESSTIRPLELRIVTNSNYFCSVTENDIYLHSSTNPYSAKVLLAPSDTAPGLAADFTHDLYMVDVPSQPTPAHPTWERWLCSFVGVRERLRLVSPGTSQLSSAFVYILEHRPLSFLGLLAHLQHSEGKQLLSDPVLREKVRGIDARKLCQVTHSILLRDTWLPLQSLKERAEYYIGDFATTPGDNFPFLKIDLSEASGQVDSKWQFLYRDFSVGHKENLDFLLHILDFIWNRRSTNLSVAQTQRVCDLYVAIAAKHAGEVDSANTAAKLKKYFSKRAILVPLPYEDRTCFKKTNSCVWQGPPTLRTKYALQPLWSRTVGDSQMAFLQQLFHKTVGVPSTSMEDIIADLEYIRDRLENTGYVDKEITDLYRCLDKMKFLTPNLRSIFSQKPLIMVICQGERGWYKLSDALWSSAATIRGKVTLDIQYEELKAFFVTKLGVKSLTLEMVYDELKQESQINSVEDVTVAMLAMSSFLRHERPRLDPSPLLKAKIFPVKYGDSEPVLRSASTDFAIADQAHLREHFWGRVAMLSFDLEDIHRLRPFFSWIELEDRFLSNSVKDITSVLPNSGNPIRAAGRDLRRKAYYILRVAATCGSPKYHESCSDLYRLLRDAETIETDGIHTSLQLSQNGQSVLIEDLSPNVFIDDAPPHLKIYVPKQRNPQTVAFSAVLPRKLLSWLMEYPEGHIEDHTDTAMINALCLIFSCEVQTLNDILDRQSIVRINVENIDDPESEAEDEEEEEEAADVGDNGRHSFTYDTPTATTETFAEVSAQSHMARARSSQSSESTLRFYTPESSVYSVSSSARSTATAQPFESPAALPLSSSLGLTLSAGGEDDRYRAILERVVDSARSASFPSRGSFNLDSLRNALFADLGHQEPYSFNGINVAAGLRSETQLERDKKVGAAGELYVYELLSKLQLSGWNRDNWQSTIRTYVRVHREYMDLERWPLRETADFVYEDSAGDFTSVLIDAGYLAEDWRSARPKYYIEVKTTTSQCSTPFYMSSHQYDLMQSIHRREDRAEVYMILRVFGLNGTLGMCAYLDPEELRQNGGLLFTGLTWSVVPGNRA